MPRLEIVTMSNHELIFPIPSFFSYTRGLCGNDILRFLMVTFGNQSSINKIYLRLV